MLSSKSLIISVLKFGCFIHFELTFFLFALMHIKKFSNTHFFIFYYKYILLWLIYNVLLDSAYGKVTQPHTYFIYVYNMYSFSHIISYRVLPQVIGYSSLYYTAELFLVYWLETFPNPENVGVSICWKQTNVQSSVFTRWMKCILQSSYFLLCSACVKPLKIPSSCVPMSSVRVPMFGLQEILKLVFHHLTRQEKIAPQNKASFEVPLPA